MLSEAELIAKRATLRWLVQQHPEWTQQDLADALKMSRSWISKWLRRLRQADPANVMALHSRSRARHTPPFSIASQPAVVQRILQMREAPPENLQRVPGPEALLYFVHRILRSKLLGCACHARRPPFGRSCARRVVSNRTIAASPSRSNCGIRARKSSST